MELLLILLPLLAIGLLSDNGGGSDDDGAPPNGTEGTVTRDTDAASALTGDAGNNMILGAGGADTLSGDDGVDALLGELGADRLSGNAGDDLLLGAWNDDTLFGGEGNDLLVGGSGNDEMGGGADSDLLFGSSGRDTVAGEDGDDLLIGLDLTEDLNAEDIAGLDTNAFQAELRSVFGADVSDIDLRRAVAGVTNGSAAESAPDILNGGDGSDILVGDDRDILIGGDGVDEFNVLAQAGSTVVTILNFDPAVESLAVLVDGPTTGALTFANDTVGDGLDVLLDGVRVANLEGVFANQIVPGSLTVASFR
jgi:serralysin